LKDQKITDIYVTAIDYSLHTAQAEKFFAAVQNTLHFAITGQTAAEIIASRAAFVTSCIASPVELLDFVLFCFM